MFGAALKRADATTLSCQEADDQAARVSYTSQFEDLGGSHAVIEAITEDARGKGELFRRLHPALPDARFLASNTSSIPIPELARWDERPVRMLGPALLLAGTSEVIAGLDHLACGRQRAC